MSDTRMKKNVTNDFLLCNRCGTCRYVCPILSVYREEWAGARGKVELAEAFFKGEQIDDKELQKVFDYCLHCMTCEENCPSGMRASEIVMAARAEMARRGKIPRVKRLAVWALGGVDEAMFKVMRSLRLVRRAPLHGVGGRGPLSFLYPLIGWPRERYIPLPARKPFLEMGPELYRAADVGEVLPHWGAGGAAPAGAGAAFDEAKAAGLLDLVAAARRKNIAAARRAYFFVGHSVNHFFPEEARAVTRLLNMLGVDVLVPKDQACCGAPVYYAGDIAGARKAAAELLEKFEGYTYDWIVTTCSSGGLMLKEEFPRIFDLNDDGYFEIGWDAEKESFYRMPERSTVKRQYPGVEDLYRQYVEGKVRDVNELVAEILGLHEEPDAGGEVLGAAERSSVPPEASAHERGAPLPVVTYHQPCHLKRGQGIDWQPEAILKRLPGYRYVRMKDFDRCCGGGGSFTFVHSEAAVEIARIKVEAIEKLRPDVVATACPLCRIQLMDMIHRSFAGGTRPGGERPKTIPVSTPAELLLDDLHRIMAQ
jgi:glycolate oxidase iron-sulfur subunit